MALLLRASRGGKSDMPFNLLAPIRDRIKQICQSIIAAGSDTTGTTLTALFYFLLHEEDAMHKLLAEVDASSSSMGDENQGVFSLQMASRNVESKLVSRLSLTSTSCIPLGQCHAIFERLHQGNTTVASSCRILFAPNRTYWRVRDRRTVLCCWSKFDNIASAEPRPPEPGSPA